MKMVNIYLYTRYERFWHWLQSAIIVLLLVTGFEVHNSFSLMGFRTAVDVHNYVGLGWLILFAFFVFWVFTTGEWRQYVPTTRKMLLVVRYYSYGIFRGEAHPVPKRKEAKHNPLQRLVYLSSGSPPAADSDGFRFSLLELQFLAGLGTGLVVAAGCRAGSHGRGFRHSLFSCRTPLYDYHRAHDFRPHPGHDHRLGGSG